MIGGVSDYSRLVARGLAEKGDKVHVWCPSIRADRGDPGVEVHPVFGAFRPRDLAKAGQELNRFAGPRCLLVQWVPHGFGYKSMNLPFCLWLWQRARWNGDRIYLMVHEPYLPFRPWRWRQNCAAFVHRLMTAVLMNAAHHVWISIPAWESRMTAYALGR
jgi:hypothetical protein